MTKIKAFGLWRIKPCRAGCVIISKICHLKTRRIFLPEITDTKKDASIFTTYLHCSMRTSSFCGTKHTTLRLCLLTDSVMISTVLIKKISVPYWKIGCCLFDITVCRVAPRFSIKLFF